MLSHSPLPSAGGSMVIGAGRSAISAVETSGTTGRLKLTTMRASALTPSAPSAGAISPTSSGPMVFASNA
ncbi:MAG: hypothetical protein M5R40_26775 [Anaerolineae bacterium]|nr:hypothetical protein [Anaerolineae bacterium]